METTTIIKRRSWSNASAFIEFNPETRKVRVYSKFYVEDGFKRRGHYGPVTDWLAEMPAELVEEAKKTSWAEPQSEEMERFCDKVFAMAKKEEPWFAY